MDDEQVERRLSAILVGDVKGFSRLVAESEMDAVRVLQAFRALAREQVEACRGRVVDLAGDGLLGEFSSIVEAARCAVELQRRVHGQQSSLPEGKTLVVQLGLSLGEVVHFGTNVLGTTVNLAHHVSRLAPPGGVAIVAHAAEQLAGTREFECEDMGDKRLRGLDRPVRIQRIVTGVELETPATPEPAEPERRLAAILEADVVSWSRLVATRERSTIDAIGGYRDALIACVEQRRGRVVDSSGDNLLAEFRSALDAVLAGIEIQRELAARNAELSADERLDFRVGIHLGDVRVDGERIYGSGVNIAARLEALAEPGGLCISASVHEQVRYHLDAEFEDIGDQELKNIPHPVRAYRLDTGGPKPQPAAQGRLRRLLGRTPRA
jgi:class 3 adenylate cyclase